MDIITAIDHATGCQYEPCGRPIPPGCPSDDFCSPEHQTAWHASRTTPLATYDEPDDMPVHFGNLVELHNPETCVTCVERTPHGRQPTDALLALVYAHAARRSLTAHETAVRAAVSPATHMRAMIDAAATRPGRTFGMTNAVNPDTPPDGYEHYRRRVMLGFDGAHGAPLVTSFLSGGQVFVADPGTPFEYIPGNRWREVGTVDGDVVFTSTTPDTASDLRRLIDTHINDRMNEAIGAMMTPRAITFEAIEGDWGVLSQYYGAQPPGQAAPDTPTDPRERALWLRRHRNTGPARRPRPPRAITPRRSR